jgi:hypothetical protein
VKLLTVYSSRASRPFLPSGPNIPLSTLFSNTFYLYPSLSLRDKVSHPYKTGKIMVYYALIFTYFERRSEDLRKW